MFHLDICIYFRQYVEKRILPPWLSESKQYFVKSTLAFNTESPLLRDVINCKIICHLLRLYLQVKYSPFRLLRRINCFRQAGIVVNGMLATILLSNEHYRILIFESCKI